MKKAELMAPAGDLVCLSAAIKAGADAVYLGVKGTNMRAGAKNFSLPELRQACKLAKKNGVRVYLTLNTIYYEDELANVEKLILRASKAGVDAFIAWDNGILSILKKHNLEAHLSTQASVSNSEAIVEYRKHFGIDRFVLARECTMEHMKKMQRNLVKKLGKKEAEKINIEIFAHGAMCISISGRCFLSEFSCGKSANRGECLQPCRRQYKIIDTSDNTDIEYEMGTDYILSPKDLCTLPFIEQLLDLKVGSLKIEGRNRNPEFVYNTVKAYRTIMDAYYDKMPEDEFEALKKSEMEKLHLVFNRGFSEGFFMGRPMKDWHTKSAGNVSPQKKVLLGRIRNFFPKICVAEIVVESGSLKIGDTIQIEGNATGMQTFQVEQMQREFVEVTSALKGDKVALKCPMRLRKSDRVYIFRKQ